LRYVALKIYYIMKTKKEKSFDAVKMMREIRDKISSETQNMTFEELKKYIDLRIKTSGLKPI
jgi:predicted nucleotide-binding protein (sugar kinase/HSP70/actin superfamily)